MTQQELQREEDEELVRRLRIEMRQGVEEGIQPYKTEIAQIKSQMAAFGQRLSRPPGAGPLGMEMNQLSLSRQLTAEAAFQSWIKSQKLPSSGYATELKMPAGRKAVTGLSPTEHIPFIYGPPAQVLRLRTLMPVVQVSSGSVEYSVESSFTPSAAVVAEGGLKPTMAATYALATAHCVTVAQVIKASLQSVNDAPQLSLWLDQRLAYSVSLKEEDVLLNDPVTGLMAHATAFAYVPATGDTGMDVLGHAIGSLMGKGFQPDGIVLNSADYTSLRLLKATTGQYIFMGTANTGPDDESIMEAAPQVWQVAMIISPSMPAGQFLVGAFQQSTILFSRDTLNVQIAFQNEDDFIKNLVCLRGELRSGAAVPVPAGLLKGTLPAITTQAANASSRK